MVGGRETAGTNGVELWIVGDDLLCLFQDRHVTVSWDDLGKNEPQTGSTWR